MARVFLISDDKLTSAQWSEANERASTLVNTKFTLSDLETEIVYRQLVYWFNEKLLISDPEVFKLRHLDFLDFCWIHFVNILRTFGLSLKSVMEIKEALLCSIKQEVLLEAAADLEKLLQGLTPEQQKDLIDLFNRNSRRTPREAAHASSFFFAVSYCLVLKQPISIFIAPNNDIVILNELACENLLKMEPAIEILKGNFIKISLTDICWKFTGPNIFEIKKQHLALLTDHERIIIDAIRDKGAREITVKFNSESVPEMMEVKKVSKVELSSRLLELLKRNQYQEITIKTQSGNITHFENKTKIKLDQGTSVGRPFIGL